MQGGQTQGSGNSHHLTWMQILVSGMEQTSRRNDQLLGCSGALHMPYLTLPFLKTSSAKQKSYKHRHILVDSLEIYKPAALTLPPPHEIVSVDPSSTGHAVKSFTVILIKRLTIVLSGRNFNKLFNSSTPNFSISHCLIICTIASMGLKRKYTVDGYTDWQSKARS